MKKVRVDNYIFALDFERTKRFYSHARRIFDCLSGYLPELTQFLEELGIDIEKPVRYDTNDTYDLLYTAYGTFTADIGYELDFYGENKFVSVVISDDKNKIQGGLQEDRIQVEVLGIRLNKR